MGIFSKLAKAKEKLTIGLAVGKIVVTGKPAKVLEKVEKGNEIFEKTLEIAEMFKKKK